MQNVIIDFLYNGFQCWHNFESNCSLCIHRRIAAFISLIPRLSHRLEYFSFRTISWSWNSSPNYFMARALRVRFHHNTHESYVCRAKCRVCGTVKSELGQWIRINIGRTRLKRNLDLISVFHCHCPRAQLLVRTQLRIKASVVRRAKNGLPSKLWITKIIPNLHVNFQ